MYIEKDEAYVCIISAAYLDHTISFMAHHHMRTNIDEERWSKIMFKFQDKLYVGIISWSRVY